MPIQLQVEKESVGSCCSIMEDKAIEPSATAESAREWTPRLSMKVEQGKPVLPPELIAKMEKNMGYRFVGPSKHSAVKVCSWTKNSLCGKGSCYKEQFYGIDSHKCLEMTPSVPFCTESCQFCWRLRELSAPKWVGPIDDPEVIIEECIKARRGMLQGFAGNPDVERGKVWESERPTQVAISLDGEPIMYPRINELIRGFFSRKMTAYLVTNGTLPEKVAALDPEPTNLYVTLAGPNEAVFKETTKPLIPDAWQRLQASLGLLKDFSCNTVIRLTLVKGLNMVSPEQYAQIIAKSEVKFLEIKAFMSVGAAREKLPYEAMPLHGEIKEFAEKVAEHSGYRITQEHTPSRVVLLER
jgi:tRNA wybutosine-synthesizing protein 1